MRHLFRYQLLARPGAVPIIRCREEPGSVERGLPGLLCVCSHLLWKGGETHMRLLEPWACYLWARMSSTYLSLSFSTCEMGIMFDLWPAKV